MQAALPLAASKALVIPANTLMIRGAGTLVAVVGADGRIKLKPIKVGRNYGQTVEVIDGVSATDQLVLNPSDSLGEGDTVTVVPAAKEAPAGKKPA